MRLRDIASVNDYASRTLRKIDTGSSRDVYTLSSKKVLKVALHEVGVEQNLNEWKHTEFSSVLPITVTHVCDEFGLWVVAELVKPMSAQEFNDRCVGESYRFHPSFRDLLHKLAQEMCIAEGDLGREDQWGTDTCGEMKLLDYGV